MAVKEGKKNDGADKLIKSLEEYITKQPRELQKQEVEGKKEMEKAKATIAILKKYLKKIPITDSEKKEISSVLCFKNLGYCCKRECLQRNAVLELCGIDKKFFEAAKEELGFNLMLPSNVIVIGSKENISESAVVLTNKKI